MRTRSVDPRPVTPRRMLAGRAVALGGVIAVAAACFGAARSGGSTPAPGATSTVSTAPSQGVPAAELAAARTHIKHVILLIKENRTFDTMFGRFRGADGATTG